MPKFPGPPGYDDLIELQPDIHVLTRGTWIWRIYFRQPPGRSSWNVFRAYGPVSQSRFDHQFPPPRIQEREILYAAVDAATCLAEVFQRVRRVNRHLNDPWLVGIAIERDLRLLNLTGGWPTAAGASMAINSGRRDRAQSWSRAIYDAYPEIDGVLYASSMNANQPSIALYERARDAMPPSPIFHRSLMDPTLTSTLEQAAARLRYVIV